MANSSPPRGSAYARAEGWRAAGRWASRAAVVMLWPWAFTTWRSLELQEEAPWVIPLPTLAAMAVVGTAALLGVVQSRRMRTIAAEMGWTYLPRASDVEHFGLRQFPFTGRGRHAGDGAVGSFNGVWACVATYGAHTTITMLSVPAGVPRVGLIPRGAARGEDVEFGKRMNVEVASLQGRWRVACNDDSVAHATFPPHSLAALDDFKATPFIALEQELAWTTDIRAALGTQDVRERLGLLADLSARIPLHVRRWDDSGVGATGAFRVSSQRRNLWGRLSVLLAFTIFLAPVGLLLGMSGVRAYRRDEATNLATALCGIVLSLAGTAVLVFGAIALLVDQSVTS